MAVSDLSNAATGRPRRSGALALPLVGMLILAAIAAGFIAYVLWPRWPGPPVSPDAPALPVTIAGTPFNVPPAAMRVPLQRRRLLRVAERGLIRHLLRDRRRDPGPQRHRRRVVVAARGQRRRRVVELARPSIRAMPQPMQRSRPMGSQ